MLYWKYEQPFCFSPRCTPSLFPVCHQLPSCLHYFSVMSVGPLTSLCFLSRDDCVHRQATRQAGPAPQTCWDMGSGTCLVSALQQSYFAGLTLGFVHSANMFVSMVQASHLCLSLIIVKNWALGTFIDPKGWNLHADLLKLNIAPFPCLTSGIHFSTYVTCQHFELVHLRTCLTVSALLNLP